MIYYSTVISRYSKYIYMEGRSWLPDPIFPTAHYGANLINVRDKSAAASDSSFWLTFLLVCWVMACHCAKWLIGFSDWSVMFITLIIKHYLNVYFTKSSKLKKIVWTVVAVAVVISFHRKNLAFSDNGWDTLNKISSE